MFGAGIYYWQSNQKIEEPVQVSPAIEPTEATETVSPETESTITSTENNKTAGIDETNNWKTYRDKKLGFSINYPNDWVVYPQSKTGGAFYTLKNYRLQKENEKNCAEGKPNCISDGYPGEVTFGEVVSNQVGREKSKEIVINGNKFNKYTTQGMGGEYEVYEAPATKGYKGVSFSVLRGSKSATLLPKMLVTFKRDE